MTKKQTTLYGMMGLVIGIFGGALGTAFSMGAEQQRVKDALATNLTTINRLTETFRTEIETTKESQEKHEDNTAREMDRYTEIIAAHITQLQTTISLLTTTVSDLRTDVHVLKALIERMEKDLTHWPNSG